MKFVPGRAIFVCADAERVIPQTKSKTSKLFEETTLYYGQPIGARLNDLFDQYVRDSRNAATGKRNRDILVISDGTPCESAHSNRCPVAHRLSADDLENVLVDISGRLDELGRPRSQVVDPHSKLPLQGNKLTLSGYS